MSLSSASAVTITLCIVSVFLMFSLNVQSFTKNIWQSVQITFLIDYNYEAQEVIDRIGWAIANIDGVKSVEFSSKDEEFRN